MESNKKSVTGSRVSGRRRYDEDFKKSVLEMIANGQSVISVSQSLGIGESLIYKWKSEHAGASSGSSSASDDETVLLRKQLKQVELERDILKKALGIFSRSV